MLISGLPGLVLLVLPGLGRAFGAVFLRETGGSAPVLLAFDALAGPRRAAGAPRPQLRPAHAVRLLGAAGPCRTRWRLRPRARSSSAACCRTSRGAAGGGSSSAATSGASRPEPPALDRGRLVYSYRVEPLGEPARPASRGPRAAPPTTPTPRRSWRRCGASGTRSTRASRGSPACSPPTSRRAPSTTVAGPRRSSRDDRHGGGRRRPRSLRAELPARAARRPAGPVPGRTRRGALDRRGAADPGDAPGSLRAEPLPLPAALGLAPPRARRLARPPRRRARGAGRPIGRTR